MADEVKTQLPRRERKAQATRQAILDAARQLFVGHGYGATTIQAIADEADVAVQTVYAVFNNKATILAEVLDASIVGDAPIAVNSRDWMAAVWEAPTATERLIAYAAAVRRIMDGAADVFNAVVAAATIDANVVEIAETTEERRRAGAAAVIDSVRKAGPLRTGLTRERAIDILWLLNSPTVYNHLVRRAGWSAPDYQTWLADTMTSQLLEGEASTSSRSRSRPVARPRPQRRGTTDG